MSTTLLIFGDSIVQGFWDPIGGGWASRLTRFLMQRDIQTAEQYVVAVNLGVAGDTTEKLLKRFEAEIQARHSERRMIIVIGIGANDSATVDDQPYVSEGLFRQNLEALAIIARRYAEHVVFIGLTPVDEEKTNPFAILNSRIRYTNESGEQFNRAIEDVAKKTNAIFIDTTALFTSPDSQKTNFDDGLHPNTGGHEQLFGHIRDALAGYKLI